LLKRFFLIEGQEKVIVCVYLCRYFLRRTKNISIHLANLTTRFKGGCKAADHTQIQAGGVPEGVRGGQERKGRSHQDHDQLSVDTWEIEQKQAKEKGNLLFNVFRNIEQRAR
jgi:hypothetical protein